MELEEAFKILEGDSELQYKYGNDGDGCINPQIAKDEALLTIRNYINFETIQKKKIEDKILQEWQKCPKNSINDFAITERNNKIKVLKELLEEE